MTYTYAVLDVSPATYTEIADKLRAAGYDHAFHTQSDDRRTVIDMHGIALAVEAPVYVPPGAPAGFSIRHLQQVNTTRAARWHADGLDEWTPMEWAGAMSGEAGEVAGALLAALHFLKHAGEASNAAKKLRRVEKPGTLNPDSRGTFTADEYRQQIAKEAADTVIYAALLCERVGIDLQDTIRQVFNAKSAECGFPERL